MLLLHEGTYTPVHKDVCQPRTEFDGRDFRFPRCRQQAYEPGLRNDIWCPLGDVYAAASRSLVLFFDFNTCLDILNIPSPFFEFYGLFVGAEIVAPNQLDLMDKRTPRSASAQLLTFYFQNYYFLIISNTAPTLSTISPFPTLHPFSVLYESPTSSSFPAFHPFSQY